MKFPYDLSELRVSLLSKEDLRIYRYEHSLFFSVAKREQAIQDYNKALLERQGYFFTELENDPDFIEESVEEKQRIAKIVAEAEMLEIFDLFADLFKDFVDEGALTEQDWINAKKTAFKQLNESYALNEAGGTPGWDMSHWAEGLGAALAGIMGTAFGGMVGLFMAGKTKMAIRQLKKYMARIVEITDDGRYKEKSRISGFLSKIKGWFGGKKDEGGFKAEDQTQLCFRKLQQDFSKDLACSGMILLKNMGYVSDNCDAAVTEIENCSYENAGLAIFLSRVADQINILSNGI